MIDEVAKRGTPEFGPLVVESNPSAALGSLVPSALPAPTAPDTDDDGAQGPPWSQDSPAPAGSDDLPPWSTPEHPEPAATPAHAPEVEASLLFSHTTTETGGGGGGIDALASAINTVLAAGEPDALVADVERGQCAARAAQCISAAQKLARLGQLLRSAAADPA